MNSLLTEKQASELLGLSKAWLQRDRWLHPSNPRVSYIRVGERAVRYKLEDLEAYIDENRKQSVSESASS